MGQLVTITDYIPAAGLAQNVERVLPTFARWGQKIKRIVSAYYVTLAAGVYTATLLIVTRGPTDAPGANGISLRLTCANAANFGASYNHGVVAGLTQADYVVMNVELEADSPEPLDAVQA